MTFILHIEVGVGPIYCWFLNKWDALYIHVKNQGWLRHKWKFSPGIIINVISKIIRQLVSTKFTKGNYHSCLQWKKNKLCIDDCQKSYNYKMSRHRWGINTAHQKYIDLFSVKSSSFHKLKFQKHCSTSTENEYF